MSDQDTQQESEASEVEAQEQKETPTDADAEPQEGDALEEIPEKDAWDGERALMKIRKLNAEVRSAKEKVGKSEVAVQQAAETNTTLTAENLRLRVGYELGIPLEMVDRLKGESREELLADAEKLLDLIAPSKRPPSKRPAENLRGGGEPEREPEETDLAKIGSRMFNH